MDSFDVRIEYDPEINELHISNNNLDNEYYPDIRDRASIIEAITKYINNNIFGSDSKEGDTK